MSMRPAEPHPPRPAGQHLTRRGALVLGGLGLAGVGGAGFGVRALGGDGVAGSWGLGADPPRPPGRATCVDAAALPIRRTLGGAPLIYDISGAPADFHLDTAFHGQLEAWLPKHVAESGLGAPAQVWTYGTWIDGRQSSSDDPGRTATTSPGGSTCTSWHNAGRALGLGRLVAGDGTVLVSCHYDLWSTLPAEQLAATRTAYWRTAAGLHRDFDSVLTYLFDRQHHNHIHIDNGLLDSGLPDHSGSRFRTRSGVQVQAVQAMCRYVWGRAVELTGDWDGATRTATQQVLDAVGVGGRLTDGAEAWQGFLTATLRRA